MRTRHVLGVDKFHTAAPFGTLVTDRDSRPLGHLSINLAPVEMPRLLQYGVQSERAVLEGRALTISFAHYT